MAHWVICSICGGRFDRDKDQFIKTSSRRYAHLVCPAADKENQNPQKDPDLILLEEYIVRLFNGNYSPIKVNKQINDYVNEKGYSYSGIRKALMYFYEIKQNSIEKANGGIGIVPYVYDEAYRYYYNLWLTQQKNENKDIKLYVPKQTEVVIDPPQRKIKKRKLFTFLDRDEVDE